MLIAMRPWQHGFLVYPKPGGLPNISFIKRCHEPLGELTHFLLIFVYLLHFFFFFLDTKFKDVSLIGGTGEIGRKKLWMRGMHGLVLYLMQQSLHRIIMMYAADINYIFSFSKLFIEKSLENVLLVAQLFLQVLTKASFLLLLVAGTAP